MLKTRVLFLYGYNVWNCPSIPCTMIWPEYCWKWNRTTPIHSLTHHHTNRPAIASGACCVPQSMPEVPVRNIATDCTWWLKVNPLPPNHVSPWPLGSSLSAAEVILCVGGTVNVVKGCSWIRLRANVTFVNEFLLTEALRLVMEDVMSTWPTFSSTNPAAWLHQIKQGIQRGCMLTPLYVEWDNCN